MFALVAAVIMLLAIMHALPYQLALHLWLLLMALQFAFGWWPLAGPPMWHRHQPPPA